jgi:hypothetical protein
MTWQRFLPAEQRGASGNFVGANRAAAILSKKNLRAFYVIAQQYVETSKP